MSPTFRHPAADVFVPDGVPPEAALARASHLAIVAHQDDAEFMAFSGIAQCYESGSDWFGVVVCTDGAGSPRRDGGPSPDELRRLRRDEQRRAAEIGRYAFAIQLGYASAEAKDRSDPRLADDLRDILQAVPAGTVYLHNPADSHPTHVAVFAAALRALRSRPAKRKVLGCEVWRGLDWLPEEAKIALDVSGHEDLARRLCAVFRSQADGGKRYEDAVPGRWQASATFRDPHAPDQAARISLAMDLTALAADPALDPRVFLAELVERFGRSADGLLGDYL